MSLDDPHEASGLRRDFVSHLQLWGAPNADFGAAALAYGELTSNVLQHASGPLDIDLDWSKCLPRLEVSDRGPGFVPRLNLPDPLSENGRGLFLVSALVGPLSVLRRDRGGMRVCVTLPVHRKECRDAGCAEHSLYSW